MIPPDLKISIMFALCVALVGCSHPKPTSQIPRVSFSWKFTSSHEVTLYGPSATGSAEIYHVIDLDQCGYVK